MLKIIINKENIEIDEKNIKKKIQDSYSIWIRIFCIISLNFFE